MTDPHSESSVPRICTERRRDGSPCGAQAGVDGFCIGHRPSAAQARRAGGYNSARRARLERLLPERMRHVIERLERVMEGLEAGTVEPKVAAAMAACVRAMVTAYGSGEQEVAARKLLEAQLVAAEDRRE
jgi:hypothetical protein